MAAYCAAVGLPFLPRAITWEPGERPEWRRSARWHVDVSASSGFQRRERVYPHTVENSPDLARFAAHHRPFYERLYAQRLDVTPRRRTARSVDSCAGILIRPDQPVTSATPSRLSGEVRRIARSFVRMAPSLAPAAADSRRGG